MNSSDVLAKVKARLGVEDTESRSALEFNIIQCVSTALQNLAKRIARESRPDVRTLLRKDFTVTITSGTGSLTAALTADEPLMIEEIMAGNAYVTSGTQPCQWLPDRSQLGLARPTFFIYYVVDGSTIRTRNTDGSLSSLSATLTLTANYVPLLTTVPSTLQDDFIEEIMLLVQPEKKELAA